VTAAPVNISAATSYDSARDFGLFYDFIPAYAGRTDVAFYAGQAASIGAEINVLEVGCGTGRVSIPLARAGHRIVGLDSSASMLARCRDKLAHESQAVSDRVTLCAGDAREFQLASSAYGPAFDLAIAPFRIMQHLITISDQRRCLAAIRRNLAPGGQLVFDVFNPNFASLLRDRTAESEDTPELELPDGRFLRRTSRIRKVRFVEQVNEVELVYYVRIGQSVERVVQAFEMRWYTKPELEHLLARSGFNLDETFGDFDRSKLCDESREMIVVASLA
jgi:SAM-dependent methyltransferase